jgi:parvulin-like peptidyl-prolyl isomerase
MSKAKASILAGMLAVTVFVSGCAGQGGMSGGKVAVVNGTVISKADFDKTYGEFEKAFHLDAAPQQQREAMSDTLKQMTMNKLINMTLLSNEATKEGIKVTDADVKQYKQEKILSNPVIAEQFHAFLKQNNMQETDFDAMLKDNLLWQKFTDAKGGTNVQVSDADVKSYYTKNTEQFKQPEQIHASHILVKAIVPQLKQELRTKNPKITDSELDKQIAAQKEQLKAKADKLYTEVKANPAKFEELAKKNSDDTMSAIKGGDLGFMAENNIDPSFWAAAEKTPDGKLYPGVVTSQFGYHVLKVLGHKAPHQLSYDEAKSMIREQMSQQKKQAFLQNWFESQKALAKIDVEPAYQPKAAEQQPAPNAAFSQQGANGAPGQVAPAAPGAAPVQQAKH